jgi:hypothetical protein
MHPSSRNIEIIHMAEYCSDGRRIVTAVKKLCTCMHAFNEAMIIESWSGVHVVPQAISDSIYNSKIVCLLARLLVYAGYSHSHH